MPLELSLAEKAQLQPATKRDSSLLSKLIREYLVDCTIEEKSAKTVSSYSQRLYDFAARSPDISASSVRLYLQELIQRSLSPSTRNAYYRCLHSFCNWMIGEGYINASPFVNLKPPKIPRKIVPSFSMDDIRKLLLLCSGVRFSELRNYAMLLVFLDTGLRLAEMAAIQRGDIDIMAGTICVMGKGAKERTVRMGKTTRKAVWKYLNTRDDIYPDLWLTEERVPLSRGGVRQTVVKLCRRAGIKGGPHKLRHTAATSYLRNGGTEFTLQIMLGHSTLAMTRRYTSNLNSDDAMKVHEKASPVDRMNLR